MATRERVDSPLRAADSVPTPVAPRPAETTRLALRELTGWEEEYLERHRSDPNTARLCNEVLARCLVEPGEEPGTARETVRRLLVAERDRELVALRTMSLGSLVRAQVDCPACAQVNEAEFSLDRLPLDFPIPDRKLVVEVPGVGAAQMRLPTAGDQEDLVEAGLVDDAERRSWLLARCLEKYDGRTDGFDLDFARGLPVKVRRTLESAIEARLPGLDLEMAVECSHCGAPFTAPFDVHVFFFRTSRARRSPPARRAPAGTCVPLVRAGHRRAHSRPATGLPAAAGGGGRRGARRGARRQVVTNGRGG